MLRLNDQLSLPESELSYRTSRSSGPGGQNVNKVETRVTVLFDVAASPTLSEEQKTRIRERLATRLDKQGVLRYEGICDNNQVPKRVDLKPETVTSHYVRDAIEAVLGGKPVQTKRVPSGST